MKSVVILTGSELRHTFMRKSISLCKDIDVLASYCENKSPVIKRVIENGGKQADHLAHRARSESDFFGPFNALTPDYSNSITIRKGEINTPIRTEEIIDLDPDLIISYGCSIIKPPLIERFKGRFVNVHLGLSPYYRGGGTNFFPLVRKEPEYVGVTFMHIDEGIDTGDIIHQLRARVYPGDGPHQIGNRLICDVASCLIKIILDFDNLQDIDQPKNRKSGLYFSSKDFTPEAVEALYINFQDGMVEKYLQKPESEKAALCSNTVLEAE